MVYNPTQLEIDEELAQIKAEEVRDNATFSYTQTSEFTIPEIKIIIEEGKAEGYHNDVIHWQTELNRLEKEN